VPLANRTKTQFSSLPQLPKSERRGLDCVRGQNRVGGQNGVISAFVRGINFESPEIACIVPTTLAGFAIILGFDLLGLLLHHFGVPLPGHVLGMILLASALFAGLVKIEWIEETAAFLLRHMLLFFVPAIVGIITYAAVLKANWLGIGGGIVVSVLASLIVTGLVANRLLPRHHPPQ
jgi:holin-like protein